MSKAKRITGTVLFITGCIGMIGMTLYRLTDWILNAAVLNAARASFGVIGSADGPTVILVGRNGGVKSGEPIIWLAALSLTALGYFIRKYADKK